jgi:hypothetical protein
VVRYGGRTSPHAHLSHHTAKVERNQNDVRTQIFRAKALKGSTTWLDLTPTTPNHLEPNEEVEVRPSRHHVGAAVLAVGLGFTRLPMANAAANPVILVNDLGDSNVCDDTTCTLRGAVSKANTTPGDDVINFGIDGTITSIQA